MSCAKCGIESDSNIFHVFKYDKMRIDVLLCSLCFATIETIIHYIILNDTCITQIKGYYIPGTKRKVNHEISEKR